MGARFSWCFFGRFEEQEQKTSEFLKDLWLNLLHRTLASINLKDLDDTMMTHNSYHSQFLLGPRNRDQWKGALALWTCYFLLAWKPGSQSFVWKDAGRCHPFMVFCIAVFHWGTSEVDELEAALCMITKYDTTSSMIAGCLILWWIVCFTLAMCQSKVDSKNITTKHMASSQGFVLEPSFWSQHLLLGCG